MEKAPQDNQAQEATTYRFDAVTIGKPTITYELVDGVVAEAVTIRFKVNTLAHGQAYKLATHALRSDLFDITLARRPPPGPTIQPLLPLDLTPPA